MSIVLGGVCVDQIMYKLNKTWLLLLRAPMSSVKSVKLNIIIMVIYNLNIPYNGLTVVRVTPY